LVNTMVRLAMASYLLKLTEVTLGTLISRATLSLRMMKKNLSTSSATFSEPSSVASSCENIEYPRLTGGWGIALYVTYWNVSVFVRHGETLRLGCG